MNLEWTMRGLAVMNDDAEEEEEEKEGEGVNDPRTNRKPNAFKDNISVRRSAERASERASDKRVYRTEHSLSSPFIRPGEL